MLSKKHLEDVCLIYNQDHRTCRYLAQDELDWSKWHCYKCVPAMKHKLDCTLAKKIAEAKKRGADPKQLGQAMGDNCSGYPIFNHLEQGYDKDN